MRRMAAPRSKYKRNVWYMAFRFNPEKDHIASYRDNEAHSQLKQKLAPGVSPISDLATNTMLTQEKNKYSGREIVGLEEKVDANLIAFVKLLRESYISSPVETKAFDFSQKVQYFAADASGDIAFGNPIGFLENNKDMYDYLKTSAEGFPFFMMLSLFPWLMHLLSLEALKKYLPKAGDSFGMGRIMGWVFRRSSTGYVT